MCQSPLSGFPGGPSSKALLGCQLWEAASLPGLSNYLLNVEITQRLLFCGSRHRHMNQPLSQLPSKLSAFLLYQTPKADASRGMWTGHACPKDSSP